MPVTFLKGCESPPQNWVDDLQEVRIAAIVDGDRLHPIVCIISHDLLHEYFGPGGHVDVFEAHRQEIEGAFRRRIETGPIPDDCKLRVGAADMSGVKKRSEDAGALGTAE